MYENIEAFLAVSRTGSFSQAARLLYISQPALTSRIIKLEELLHTQLVSRKKGGHTVELTQAGRDFILLAEKWESLADATKNFGYAPDRYSLKVAVSKSLINYTFVPFFTNIITMEPPFDLHTKTGSFDIPSLVDTHECDIGFVNQTTGTRNLNLIRTPVFQESFKFVCSPSFPCPDGLISPKDLNPEQEIFSIWNADYLNWHRVWFGSSSNPHATIDVSYLFEHIIMNGCYWSIAPSSVAFIFASKGAHIRDFVTPPPDRIINLLTRPSFSNATHSSLELFEKLLREYLKQTDGIIPLI